MIECIEGSPFVTGALTGIFVTVASAVIGAVFCGRVNNLDDDFDDDDDDEENDNVG